MVTRRHEMIRDAYAALGRGEFGPWHQLLDRAVVWQGVRPPDHERPPT